MTEPLKSGNFAMKADDPSVRDWTPELPFLGRTMEDLLFRAYRLRSASRCARGFRLTPDPGFEGSSLGLDGLLVVAAVRRVLVRDHLVLAIDALYGGEPEDIQGLTEVLSAFSGCSLRLAFEAVESYSLGRLLSSHPSRPERKLDEWHEGAIATLRKDFARREWIPNEALDTDKIL